MPLELPGYERREEPKFRGAVYLGPAREENQTSVHSVILARRARKPRTQEVMSYLRRMVQEVRQAEREEYLFRGKTPWRSELVRQIQGLPDYQAEGILANDARMRELFASSVEGDCPAGLYVILKAGVVPVEIQAINERKGIVSGDSWYNAALENITLCKKGFGFTWRIRFSYKDGKLPDRRVVDELLPVLTADPDATIAAEDFDIAGEYDIQEVEEVIGGMYATAPEEISRLPDSSGEAFKESVAAVLQTLREQARSDSTCGGAAKPFAGIERDAEGNVIH